MASSCGDDRVESVGRSRVGRASLLVWLSAVLLALLASAGTASALPGDDLAPIRGMAYQPAPSDYTGNGAGVYYDTDFFNDDFKQLWSTESGGRGDLRTMATQLRVNFLHLYDWNAPPARKHLSFLNEALANGIRVAVPISNYFVANDPNAATHIEAIVREVYSDGNGNPTTVPHPAVAMWTVSNEYDYNGYAPQLVSQAVARLVAAEQTIGATRLLPVSVPVSFGVYAPHPEPGVSKTLEVMAALNTQAGLPSDFVATRFIAATNPQNPGSDIAAWLPKFKQLVPNTPLWFSEMGTAVQNSCNLYPAPCTPDEVQQSIFNLDQWKAAPVGAEGILLGGAQFEWVDEPWKGGTEATFGIQKFASPNNFRTVPTTGGAYRVDELVQKPSWSALQSAFAAGGGYGSAPVGSDGVDLDGDGVPDVDAVGGPAGSAAANLGAGLCDVLYSACGASPPEEPAPIPAPSEVAVSGGSAAGGVARMPNLRAVAVAGWEGGTVEVRVRVLIARPGLVQRSFLVRVAIPSLERRVDVRVAAGVERVVEKTVELSAPASAVGRRVVVTVDPTGRVLEARERDNVTVARVRAPSAIVSRASGATGAAAPCTKSALRLALKAAANAPVKIQSFACKNGWASGAQTVGRGAGSFDAAFLARDKNGHWVVPKKLPCNNPSIPKSILKSSPCEVS